MKTLIKMTLQLLFMLLTAFSYAQVGIGTETPKTDAILELKSDDKTLLLPRLDSESSITSPLDGMIYYDKDLNSFRGRANVNFSKKIRGFPLFISLDVNHK